MSDSESVVEIAPPANSTPSRSAPQATPTTAAKVVPAATPVTTPSLAPTSSQVGRHRSSGDPKPAVAAQQTQPAVKPKKEGEKKEDNTQARGGTAVEEDESPELEFVGAFKSKIVGIQHYKGIVSKRESLKFVRTPQNKFDKNAIEVHNSNGDMVGHVPREVAAVLAPIWDKLTNAHIEITARTTTRVDNVYSIPMEVELWSSERYKKKIQQFVAKNSYTISEWNTAEPQGYQGNRGSQEDYQQTTEDLFSNLNAVDPSLQPVDPTDAFVGELLPYQRYSLAWMLRREKLTPIPFPESEEELAKLKKSASSIRRKRSRESEAEHINASENVGSFFWTISSKPGAKVRYTNMLTNFTTETHPTLPRGGILADDMGLGKTVQLLALISHPVSDVGGKAKPTGKAPTLIVCPVSLVRHWEVHAAQFLPKSKVGVYYGDNRNAMRTFAAYDIVLTTYGVVRSDCDDAKSPLFTTSFGRVLLDEAHTIKNSKSATARSCCKINAAVRWGVTGTPLQNKLDDLFSLLKFLQMSPFDNAVWWRDLILRPLRAADLRGPARLAAILRMCCIRRTKDDMYDGKPLVVLPPLTREIRKLEFSPPERKQYDELKAATVEKFNALLEAQGSNAKGKALTSGLVLLLRLRQFCDDKSLALKSDTVAAFLKSHCEKLTAEERQELSELILTAGDESCCVCLDAVTDPAVTRCRHLFCAGCIQNVQDAAYAGKAVCPLCRADLEVLLKASEMASLRRDQSASATGGSAPSAEDYGTKIRSLLGILQEEHPSEKVVVFSQWTSMLDAAQRAVAQAGIKSCRLDGSMAMAQRQESIARFEKEEDCRVMLLSLMAGGTGLNLVCASVCVLLDPWWNPSIDRQAIMRVHRIGQKKPVKVVQLVVGKTVEDGVMKLQEKKQVLVDSTVGRSGLAQAGVQKSNADSSPTSTSIGLSDLKEFFK